MKDKATGANRNGAASRRKGRGKAPKCPEKSGHLRQEIKNFVKSLKCQKLKRAGKSSSSYSEIPVPPAGLESELKQNYCL